MRRFLSARRVTTSALPVTSSGVVQPVFGCFVTGTDTEIGKTLVSSALLIAWGREGLRTVGMKPVAAGTEWRDDRRINQDVESLKAAANVVAPPELVCPYLWDAPIAPHIAAGLGGVDMRPDVIVEACRTLGTYADFMVVEGVGGFCVPLSDTVNMAELARQLNLPVVLVVGLRLGCINHALLTAEAVAARGLQLAAWVANTVDTQMPYLDENIATLSAALPAPLLGRIPRLSKAEPALAAEYLDLSVIPQWRERLRH